MIDYIYRLRSGFLTGPINLFGHLYLAFWNWFICYIPSYKVRVFFAKYFYFVKMGRNVNIHMGVRFLKPWGISIGNDVNIQMGSFIDGRGGVSIGSNVDITLGVKILSQQHDVQDGLYTTQSKMVSIGDNCVVGSYSLILPGCVIGDGVVVGAGSVVSKDLEPWCVAVGNPCLPKKSRNKDVKYKIGYKRLFH